MTALRKALVVEEEPVLATAVVRTPAVKLYVVPTGAPAEATAEAPETAGNVIKNIALFFAAPFIGLAYILAFPFVGLGLLAVVMVRVAAKFTAVRTLAIVLKHIGMLLAAPFIGLAYVVFFPVICLAVLTWTGGRAALGTGMR